MSDNNRVSYWGLYFSASSSTLLDEDTTCIRGKFVDQTKAGRVTDTRIGRASVQSETDKLEDSTNRDLTNSSEEKGTDLPFKCKNLTY